jgi:hypothetical protein
MPSHGCDVDSQARDKEEAMRKTKPAPAVRDTQKVKIGGTLTDLRKPALDTKDSGKVKIGGTLTDLRTR